MRIFEQLVSNIEGKIAVENSKTNPDQNLVNSLKVELKALQLVHDDLSNAAAVAIDVADAAANGGTRETPKLEDILSVNSIIAMYLPVVYKQLVATGELPMPTLMNVQNAGNDGEDQPS